MNVYVDHNFLIGCIKNSEWRRAVVDAHQSGIISIVLSPWHFYEYGNARAHADTEDLIRFAEDLQPKWTMERADLQLFEFWIVWNQIWHSSTDTVEPVGTFSEIVAVLSKVHYMQTEKLTMRDYVTAFSGDKALEEIQGAMEEQANVAGSNLKAYVEGRFVTSIRQRIELGHLAAMRARLEMKGATPQSVYARANALLTERPITTQLECFIFWGCMRYLKCYQVEAAFTEELYATGGKLNRNRFVDRQHASIGLPYCDRFITSDEKLLKSCVRVKAKLPFTTAEVIGGNEFIQSLQSKT
jgi:hypothetical protein